MLVLILPLSIIIFAELFVRILSHSRNLNQNIDYILLLGANGRITSPVTQDRAHNAVQALKEWPQAKLIVTGNENKGEVTAFSALLQQHGVYDFVIETKSKNTWDNMVLSLPFLDTQKTVLVVTSQYHQRRALAMARSLGLNSYSYGQDRVIYKNRHYFFIKERLSNVRYLPHLLWNSLKSVFR